MTGEAPIPKHPLTSTVSITTPWTMLNAPKVEMLQASIDENDESHFRFLVDKSSVKYVTIDHGIFSADEMAFAPALLPLLPSFSTSDWNVGRISKNQVTGRPVFSEWTREILPSVRQTWKTTFVDVLDLSMHEKVRTNVYRASHPTFTVPVIAKFAIFPWEIQYIEAETRAYQWIEGSNIGPQFLDHITEGERTVGFLLEEVSGARHAAPADLVLCQEAVARLHSLGIRHGDLNRHNILLSAGRAILIDFDAADSCRDVEAMRIEYEGLYDNLRNESGIGGSVRVDEIP